MSYRMTLAEVLIGKMAVAIVLLVLALLVSWGLILTGHAEDNTIILHESGHFSGSGYHEISASGSLCSIFVQPANDSIVWRIFSNGTLVGAA